MTREAYKSNRQVIDVTDFETIDFDEEILICVPKFAWVVARSYLSLQAQWVSSYAVEYFSNGYETPSEAQIDTIKANLAEFLAEAEVTGFVVGQIVMFGGPLLPDGFLWCDGQTFDPIEYADLYSVIGETYGVESGEPLLPDLEERFPMGASGSYPRGDTGGEKEHTLTVYEMPSHWHPIYRSLAKFLLFSATSYGFPGGGNEEVSDKTQLTGGGAAHNNMPPYLAVNFIIYAGGG